jgi:NodT family efflux transporter outer membrane factor (OMF) lipoprotein
MAGRLPEIPVSLPSQLLERRPDIAGAERRVAYANTQVGIAQTAFYPTLNLALTAGLEAGNPWNLVTWPARFFSLGPTLTQTLFDAGQRRAVTEQDRDLFEASVAAYRQTVLTAFQQVEDGLSALRILAQEADQQADAVRSAERTLQLTTAQYKGGITVYLQVITAQEAALSNERTAVSLLTSRMTESVALVQALGGGWNASELPSAKDLTGHPPTEPRTGEISVKQAKIAQPTGGER